MYSFNHIHMTSHFKFCINMQFTYINIGQVRSIGKPIDRLRKGLWCTRIGSLQVGTQCQSNNQKNTCSDLLVYGQKIQRATRLIVLESVMSKEGTSTK